jgi:hypothetical protein
MNDLATTTPDLGLILAIVIPLLVVQVALMIVALRDLLRPDRRVRGGDKRIWIIVIVLGELIGPLVYLAFGRVDE